MFEKIDKIRRKSEKEKRRIAFLTAFAFSITIFIFWFFAVMPSFKKQSDVEKKIQALESTPKVSFSSLFSGKLTEMKDQLAKIKDFTQTFSTGGEYYISTSTDVNASTTTGAFNTTTTNATTTEEIPF